MQTEPKRRKRQLRQFLYLDHDLVHEFLAPFEGGIFDQETKSTETRGERGVGGRVGTPFAGVEGNLGKDTRVGQERTTHQTSSSEFSRLYDHLEAEDLVQPLPAVDEGIWAQLEQGELVEFPATVALPGFSKMLDLAAGMAGILPLMQSLGAGPTDPAAVKAIEGMAQLQASDSGPVSLIASVAAYPRFRFLCQLNRSFLRASANALEGEATVIGKIQRKLFRAETVSAVELFPGMNRLSKKQRREFERNVGNPKIPGMEFGPSSIAYPGAILTPIAIYR